MPAAVAVRLPERAAPADQLCRWRSAAACRAALSPTGPCSRATRFADACADRRLSPDFRDLRLRRRPASFRRSPGLPAPGRPIVLRRNLTLVPLLLRRVRCGTHVL